MVVGAVVNFGGYDFFPFCPTVFDLAALPELGIRPLKLYAAFANPAAVPWLLHIILNQF